MTIDQSLTFNLHLNQLIKTISYKLLLLQKLRNFINSHASLQIYKSMVLPYFDYGDVLYLKSNTKLLNKLQTLQNRALRICFGNRVLINIDEMHRQAKLCKLEKRRNIHVYNFMFKQKENQDIVDVREICTRAHDAILFNTIIPKCEKYKKNVYYYGARMWNELPVKERKMDRYETFKNVQKRKVLNP